MTGRPSGVKTRDQHAGLRRRVARLSAAMVLSLQMYGCGGEENAAENRAAATATTASGSSHAEIRPADDHEREVESHQSGTTIDSTSSSVLPDPMLPMQTESPETQQAREIFASLLGPLTPEEWDAAQLELERLGDAVTPVLIEALESNSLIEREMAAQELVMLVLDVSDYQNQLLTALDDPSVQVRGVCAVALLTQSPESADRVIAVLIDVLRTGDSSLREMAAVNLSTFPEAVVGELQQVIKALPGAPPNVAIPLIQALEVAGPQAVEARSVLEELANGPDPEIAAAAQQALETISGPAE